ncbi:FMN-dependent oxidoreductase (nitrilotriacetate monooxygenase family) [Rhodococcus opacus]|nr:FMN-dependent oxidoreductase (nitrilotriacetate monooxygenase family) [Rhodococcus opacus]
MSNQMHLFSFIMHSPINHTVGSWALPGDDRLEGLASTDYWKEMGETLERGCFDAAFFADIPAAFDQYRDSADDAIKYGVCWPSHDPLIPLAIMASATKHLGLVMTKSISAISPYYMVRSLSTLDYISGGRVGWNVVTGHVRAEHRAAGLNMQMEHDARYDRADEYLDICRELWNGIEPGAIVADKETGIYADPAQVRRVNHHGEHLDCEATPPVLPSAQGHPVLFQAGSSNRGQTFAVNNAEAIFAVQHKIEGMKKFMADVSALAESEGKPEPRVTFGVQIIVADTDEEAEKLQKELSDNVILDAALARLSGTLGVDFSKHDLDKPMQMQKTQGGQGSMKTKTDPGLGTLRDLAIFNGTSTSMPQIVGSPETVANKLEEIWRETGCFGFNITPTTSNKSVVDFVDKVVPLLQERGALRKTYAATTLRGNMED